MAGPYVVKNWKANLPADQHAVERHTLPCGDVNARRCLKRAAWSGSGTSRTFVGAIAAAVIQRFADAYGPLRVLVIGEEWGQLYVSNFHEILTLYREGGINFLGVFQNAAAQIETKYGKETARIWRKAVAIRSIEACRTSTRSRRSSTDRGRTLVMVRGFNVNNNQVNGSGDNLSEQSRHLLQVEDIRAATGGDKALLESRDHGFFTVDLPNFWEQTEMEGLLRDVRTRPDKYDWLNKRAALPLSAAVERNPGVAELLVVMRILHEI